MFSLSQPAWAKLASIFAGLIFGIYWIPLRAMDQSGFSSLWSIALFNLTACVFVLPYIIYHWRQFIPGRFALHTNPLFAGTAFVLYASAFIHTEVIRTIVLFYLMPIWGFIFARAILGEKITGIRWLSMTLGLLGLVVICGTEQGFPLPSNLGDWMALTAGVLWAYAATKTLQDKQEPLNYTAGFIFWTTVIAIAAALVATNYGVISTPEWSQIKNILLWLVPFTLFLTIPGAFCVLYAPSVLNPGVVGLFFMIEISVGTITAALFAGEPFGAKEIAGVTLITLAGSAETIYDLIEKNK